MLHQTQLTCTTLPWPRVSSWRGIVRNMNSSCLFGAPRVVVTNTMPLALRRSPSWPRTARGAGDVHAGLQVDTAGQPAALTKTNLGRPYRGSRRRDLHRQPLEAAQHIIVMARGFGGELDRFDLAHEGAKNRFTFESGDCLADTAVNARP